MVAADRGHVPPLKPHRVVSEGGRRGREEQRRRGHGGECCASKKSSAPSHRRILLAVRPQSIDYRDRRRKLAQPRCMTISNRGNSVTFATLVAGHLRQIDLRAAGSRLLLAPAGGGAFGPARSR